MTYLVGPVLAMLRLPLIALLFATLFVCLTFSPLVCSLLNRGCTVVVVGVVV
jgi:hypothetical protein